MHHQSTSVGASPAIIAALTAGACGAVQPKLNAVLGTRIGSTLLAALVNFAVAFAVIAMVLVRRPATRAMLRRLRTWPVPPWTFTAGLGGVWIVVAGVLSVETIGVAIFSVAFFAGQIGFGALVDRFGVAPGGRRPLTTARLQAASLAIVAVVLSQLGRPFGELAPGLVALVVLAGAALALQSAFNGRIVAATGDPVAATAVNVTVGATALTAIVAATVVAGGIGEPDWPAQPWLYMGGVLGVTLVLTTAIAASALGVLRAVVVMLAAQLVAAFSVDWVVGERAPTPGVIAGSLLIVVAAALVGRAPREASR